MSEGACVDCQVAYEIWERVEVLFLANTMQYLTDRMCDVNALAVSRVAEHICQSCSTFFPGNDFFWHDIVMLKSLNFIFFTRCHAGFDWLYVIKFFL